MSEKRAENRQKFDDMGILWFMELGRELGGGRIHIEDRETGEVVRGTIKPAKEANSCLGK